MTSIVKRKPLSIRVPEEVIALVKRLAIHDGTNATQAVIRAIKDTAKRDRVK